MNQVNPHQSEAEAHAQGKSWLLILVCFAAVVITISEVAAHFHF